MRWHSFHTHQPPRALLVRSGCALSPIRFDLLLKRSVPPDAEELLCVSCTVHRLQLAIDDKDAKKKMSATNAKSLNAMKQKLKKHNEEEQDMKGEASSETFGRHVPSSATYRRQVSAGASGGTLPIPELLRAVAKLMEGPSH